MRFHQFNNSISRLLGRPFSATVQAGMSMIEIMIVISLIGMMMTFLIRNVMGAAEAAKINLTKAAMKVLVQDMQRYKLDNFKYPTTEQGFAAFLKDPGGDVKNWHGPYIDDESKIRDPWDTPYKYESDGRKVKIMSAGGDQEWDTADDISDPPAEKTGSEPTP